MDVPTARWPVYKYFSKKSTAKYIGVIDMTVYLIREQDRNKPKLAIKE